MTAAGRRLRVAVCADFREERWPSMDRVADMLVRQLRSEQAGTIDVTPVVPAFTRRATRLWRRDEGTAYTFDRIVNRLWDYPRHVAPLAGDYDIFHVIDHSYAQLVHRLPAARTVVTCHDLDTFRSLPALGGESRSWPYKAMMQHVLAGLGRAARVICDTAAIRDELIARELVAAGRLSVAPLGVGPEFSTGRRRDADAAAARLVGGPPDAVELLHVGDTIARKRIDLLFELLASLQAGVPALRLVHVGAPFTDSQARLARDLGIDRNVVALASLDDLTLAALYRRAALVVLPSDREGFGFPLVEAMACGTPVVASDLAVLREVGGAEVEYCPAGSVDAWRRRIAELLDERQRSPARWQARIDRGVSRAGMFTWARFANLVADVYGEVAAESAASLARSSA